MESAIPRSSTAFYLAKLRAPSGMRHCWEIPDDVLKSIPAEMQKIIDTGTNRDAVAAARVLVMLARQNETRNPALHLHQHQHGDVSDNTEMSLEQWRASIVRRLNCLKKFGGHE